MNPTQAVEKALVDGINAPATPIAIEDRISSQIKIASVSSLDTETVSAVDSAWLALTHKLNKVIVHPPFVVPFISTSLEISLFSTKLKATPPPRLPKSLQSF